MRKLLIFAILVASIAAWPLPPEKEHLEVDPPVEVTMLEEMMANFEVLSQGTVWPGTETILFARVWDFQARLQGPSAASEILD